MTTTEHEQAAVVEHITHAAAQRAYTVRTIQGDRVLTVRVDDAIARYSLATIVTHGDLVRAVLEEPDGTFTEELTGESRLTPGFTVHLTGRFDPTE